MRRLSIEEQKKFVNEYLQIRKNTSTWSKLPEKYGISISYARDILKKYNVYLPRQKGELVNKIPYSKEEIENALVINEYNILETCKKLNVSDFIFQKWLKTYNISVQKRNWDLVTKEMLEKLHYEEKLNGRQIADILETTVAMVSYLFRIRGIVNKGFRTKRKHIENMEEFLQLYNDNSLTSVEMAKKLKVDFSTLKRWIKECNLEPKRKKAIPVSDGWPAIEKVLDLHYKKGKTLVETGNELNITEKNVRSILRRNGYKTRIHSISVPEKEIKEFLESFNILLEKRRDLISGKRIEIDLYNEKHNIAIEFNGIYYHSDKFVSDTSAYKKYMHCITNNVDLYTIFENEWRDKKEIVKSLLLSKFGIFENKIYARDCQIMYNIQKDIANRFLEENHLQGKVRHTFSVGLQYNNELIGLMTFGKHHRNSNNGEIVLSRMCFKLNYQIIGGASKLFKNACKMFSPESKVISWSDNRYSNGNVYRNLGFYLHSELRPDYYYTKQNKLFKKQNFQKKKINCPDSMTERKYCREILGLRRIYDCGKKKWVFNT